MQYKGMLLSTPLVIQHGLPLMGVPSLRCVGVIVAQLSKNVGNNKSQNHSCMKVHRKSSLWPEGSTTGRIHNRSESYPTEKIRQASWQACWSLYAQSFARTGSVLHAFRALAYQASHTKIVLASKLIHLAFT